MKYNQILNKPLTNLELLDLPIGQLNDCQLHPHQLVLPEYSLFSKMQIKLSDDYGININLDYTHFFGRELVTTSCTLKTNNGNILSYVTRVRGWL